MKNYWLSRIQFVSHLFQFANTSLANQSDDLFEYIIDQFGVDSTLEIHVGELAWAALAFHNDFFALSTHEGVVAEGDLAWRIKRVSTLLANQLKVKRIVA